MKTRGSDPDTRLDLRLRSEFDELERAVEETEAFMASHSDDEDLIYRVVLVVSEAVTNSIVHGNRKRPEKAVLVELRAFPDMLRAAVEDEGEGFDPSAVANPLKDENLLKESGRGIYLIESLTDQCWFEKDGRRLVMEFDASGNS